MNLNWSHVATGNGVMDTLPRGVQRYCDLGKVLEPTDQRAKVSVVEEEFPPMIGVALFSIATTVAALTDCTS